MGFNSAFKGLINTVCTGWEWSECEFDDSFPSVKTRNA